MRALVASDGTLRAPAFADRGFYRVHDGFPEWAPTDDPQEVLDEALSYACRSARIEAAELLIGWGADPNGVAYMCPPLHWVARTNHTEVADWLLAHGADVNRLADFGGNRGLAPLHCAVWSGRIEMVRFLVSRGADLDLHDRMHQSPPASWARHFGLDDIARVLEDAART